MPQFLLQRTFEEFFRVCTFVEHELSRAESRNSWSVPNRTMSRSSGRAMGRHRESCPCTTAAGRRHPHYWTHSQV